MGRWGRVYDVWISFGSVHEVRAFRVRKRRSLWFRKLEGLANDHERRIKALEERQTPAPKKEEGIGPTNGNWKRLAQCTLTLISSI